VNAPDDDLLPVNGVNGLCRLVSFERFDGSLATEVERRNGIGQELRA